MLYEKMATIADDMARALSANDFEKIAGLLSAHTEVLKTLTASGISPGVEMKSAIEEADHKVRSVITTIQGMQLDIKHQLSTMNNKRRIHSAYNV
ncbi:hypothetical protein JCM14469_05450 [Desulfatiferula olefinivorans]